MTREEQIELMKECLEDAGDLVSGSTEILLESDESRCSLAAAFFQYRAGQRDGSDPRDLIVKATRGSRANLSESEPSEFMEVTYNTLAIKMDTETCAAEASIIRLSDDSYYDARTRSFVKDFRFNPMVGKHPLFTLNIPYDKLEIGKYGVHLIAFDAKGSFTDTHNIFEVKARNATDIPGDTTDKAADVEENQG